MIKRKPHHDLVGIRAKFARVDTLEITRAATEGFRALGFTRQDVVAVVQALEPADFVKSGTTHSPPNSRVWHDTYITPWKEQWLYLKFAGQTLIDVTLTSFKEAGND